MVCIMYLSHFNAFALHDLGISIPCVESHRGSLHANARETPIPKYQRSRNVEPLPNKPCLMRIRFRKQRNPYL